MPKGLVQVKRLAIAIDQASPSMGSYRMTFLTTRLKSLATAHSSLKFWMMDLASPSWIQPRALVWWVTTGREKKGYRLWILPNCSAG